MLAGSDPFRALRRIGWTNSPGRRDNKGRGTRMSIRIRGRAALSAAALITSVWTSVPGMSAQADRAPQPNQEKPNEETQRVHNATAVLQQVLSAKGPTIPPAVLEKAVAIVSLPFIPPTRSLPGEGPATRRARFMHSVRSRGIMSVRGEDGRWSVPAFVNLQGGSPVLGDVILVVLSPLAVSNVVGGSGLMLKSAVAGPISPDSKTDVDIPAAAEVLIYLRSRNGLTGTTLVNSRVLYDGAATKQFYGKAIAPQELFKETKAPEPVPAWHAALENHVPR
jgi:SH3 domain-containing YSC84-like protein 1